MSFYLPQGKAIHLGERAGAGGEATVYRVMGLPDRLAKIYQPGPRPDYPAKLAWMLDHPPENPTRAFEHASLAWPTALLYATPKAADEHLVGYLMPFVRGSIPIISLFNPRLRAKTMPQFDRRYLHRAARNLAAALGALHSRGYVVGDLNESNILVTPSALVTLIDTDSFQVQEQGDGQNSSGAVHYCPVGKLEYTPPELQGQLLDQVLRLPEHDAFGLGVLIFQLLMEGNHPFRAQWLAKGEPPPLETRIAQGAFPYIAAPNAPVSPPANAPDLNHLHPRIAELVRRCFADGHARPALRPTPLDWELAVAEAEKGLITCGRGHIYSNHLPDCPQCRRETARAGQPSERSQPAAGQARGVHRSSQAAGAARVGAAPAASGRTPAAGMPAAGMPAAGTRPATATVKPGTTQPAHSSRPANAASGPGAAPPAGSSATLPQKPLSPPARLQQMAWEWAKRQARDYVRTQILGMPPAPAGTPAPAAGTPAPPAGTPAPTNSSPAQPASNPAPSGRSAAPQASGGAYSSSSRTAPPTGTAAAQAPAHPGRPSTAAPASRPVPAPAVASRPGSSPTVPNRPTTAARFPRPAWSIPSPMPGSPGTGAPSTPSHGAAASGGSGSATIPGRTYAPPASQPARPGGFLHRYTARPPVEKIFLRSAGYGAGYGLLAGITPALLAAILTGMFNPETAAALLAGVMAPEQAWALLVTLGGAAGAALRGWQPGKSLSEVITFSIGWRRLLQAIGILTGAALGALLSLPLIWAILPVFAGLFLGGMLGFSGGRKVWEWGLRVGWERISVGLTAVSCGIWGASIARWLALTAAGAQTSQWAGDLSTWVSAQTAVPLLGPAAAAVLAGALGGAIGGFLVDLSARLLRLTE